MKTILTLVALLFVPACAQLTKLPRTYPWECLSKVEPIDAVVTRKEDGYFIYDCDWNGEGGETSGGDGGGGGAGGAK